MTHSPRFLSGLLALVLMLSLSACGEGGATTTDSESSDKKSFETAIDYNDYIVSEQNKIIQEVLAFSNNDTAMLDSAQGNRMIDAIVEQSEASLEALKGIEPFEGGADLLKAAKDLFKFYGDMADNQYREMVSILSKGQEMTAEDEARMDEIVMEIEQQEGPLDQAFAAAQQGFAAQHNMQLQRNSMQDDIDNIQ